ncbi:MAG: YjgP/YjgQ family permease [Thermotogae bacterium]|nr:YjgP/YjgQ family permease [Thermotogota bacterium]
MIPTKIDRYVLREYLKVFLVLVAGVVAIFVVVNFFEMTDKIADHKPSPKAILRYYAWMLPYLLSILMPIAELLACFFSVGEMNRRLEILALKASGIDIWRVFLPILIVGVINVGIGIFLNWELVPKGRLKAAEIKAVEIEKRRKLPSRTFARNLSFFGEGNRLYFFTYINAKERRAQGISIFSFDKERHIKERIDAVAGKYEEGKWVLEGVIRRTFKGDEEVFKKHASYVDTLMKETPEQFLKPLGDSLMTTPELLNRIDFLHRAGLPSAEERTELAIRFLFPLMNFIILLIGLPLAVFSGTRGGNRAFSFGSSLFLAFFYWGALQSARALGETGKLDPWVAAAIPNLLFLLIAIPLILKMHR